MRNIYNNCCDGEPIIGKIIFGNKYPFGTVSEETYTADMEALNGRIEVITANVNIVTGTVETLSQIVIEGQLNEKVSSATADIIVLKGSVGSLSGQVTSLTEGVRALDSEVVNVESNVNNNASAITSIRSDITRLDTALRYVQEDYVKAARDIAAVQSTLASVGADCERNKTEITDVKSRMSMYENGLSTLRNQIQNVDSILSDRIDALTVNINAIRQDLNTLQRDYSGFTVSMAEQIATINQKIENMSGGEAIEILSFTAEPATCEKGGTENVVLTWVTKGDVKVVRIDGTVVTGNSYTMNNVASPKTVTLSVTDAKGLTITKNVDIKFTNHSYWGVDGSGEMSEGVVKGLDYTDMLESKAKTFTLNPNNEYIYYSYPKRLGTSQFFCSGFEGGFTNPSTIVVNNHSGYTEDYYVYRSENRLTGHLEIVVK